MTRVIFSCITTFLLVISFANAQMEVSFEDVSGDAGTQVSVDVTSNNFPALVLFQFSVNWDSTVMRINSITNINPNLPSYSPSNFSLPATSADLIGGQMATSWDHPAFEPTTLPPGEVLFTMVFDLVGNPGDMTAITVSDNPTVREAVLSDFSTDVGVVGAPGSATINGGGGGGGNNDDLTVTVADRVVEPSGTVCLPITVQNFTDIQSFQFSINWDPTIAAYNRTQSFALPPMEVFNSGQAASGDLGVFWSAADATAQSLADGDVLFEICFDAVGPVGAMTGVSITDSPVDIEFFGNGNTYVLGSGLTLNAGSITIEEGVVTPPTFEVGMVSGAPGSIVCVPVNVQDFNQVVSFNHSISWDDSHLAFDRTDNYSLAGLGGNDFSNVTSERLNVSWDSPTAMNLDATNGQIYDVCFEILSPCDNGTERPVNVGLVGLAEVGRISSSGVDVVVNGVTYNNGGVTCQVALECPTITAIAADCQDGSGDLLVSDISSFDDNCECQWSGPAMQTTTVGSGSCNFVGVPPGDYTLTIVCSGETICTLDATVDPAPTVTLNGNVTNASCGSLGSITVLPDGGTMPYSYNWSSGQNTPTITDLEPNDYTVTVTDAAGCSSSRTFSVTAEIIELSITNSSFSDVSCNGGNDGMASIEVEGGCTPYQYTWDGTSSTEAMAGSLQAGNVSVTVTDDTGDTVTMSFMISEPEPIMVVATTNPACDGEMEGSITLAVSGGISPYTASWAPAASGLSLDNLLPGDYSVTITDANNCTFEESYTVETRDPAMCDGSCPIVDGFMVSDYNSFGVSCAGSTDGSVEFDLTQVGDPLTVDLSGPVTASQSVTSDGVVAFDGLSAGEYVLTSTDENAMVCTLQVFTLTEPQPFTVSIVNVGNVVSGCDGIIDYELTGGVGNVDCFLNGELESDCDFSNLCAGMYVISFVDANGCEVERMQRIEDTNGGDGPCYEANLVITPNDDGANDFFVISCVEDFPTDLQVYDRWGALVFEQENYDNSWQAVDLNGEDLLESGYMYVLSVNFGSGRREIFKGTVTVLR